MTEASTPCTEENIIEEVLRMHTFMAEWMRGAVENTEAELERMGLALTPQYHTVNDKHGELDKEKILDTLRNVHGSVPEFQLQVDCIQILNCLEGPLDDIASADDETTEQQDQRRWLVSYEQIHGAGNRQKVYLVTSWLQELPGIGYQGSGLEWLSSKETPMEDVDDNVSGDCDTDYDSEEDEE